MVRLEILQTFVTVINCALFIKIVVLITGLGKFLKKEENPVKQDYNET